MKCRMPHLLPRRAAIFCAALETLEPRLCLTAFIVSNVNDSGTGSLRQAILNANANSGPDQVTFQSGLSGILNLTSASLTITDPLTITGPGASVLTVRRSPSASTRFRIFDSTASALTISDLTISGGNPLGSGTAGSGGALRAIATSPSITLDRVIISGNTPSQFGGALYLSGGVFLSLRNSTISSNSAGTDGGGIRMVGGGSFTIDNSSISNNSSSAGGFGDGGAILFSGAISTSPPPGFIPGTLTISNSTINNNTSIDNSGGIVLFNTTGNLTLTNCTMTANSSGYGGGAISVEYDTNGILTIQNSTISGNTSTGPFGGGAGGIFRISTLPGTINITNSIVSGNIHRFSPDITTSEPTTINVNYSAIGSAAGFTMSASSGNNLAFGANLLLGPLANNGGPTQTMLQKTGSPLIDAGSNALVPSDVITDQRGNGFARISGASVDIGAVEIQDILPAVQSSQFNYTTGPQSLSYTFNEPVTVDKAALELHNATTSLIIPADKIALAYDSSTNTATFTFPGYPNGALPDGDYRAFLFKTGVEDSSHNHPAIDHMTIFDFLQGDLNHDRNVSIADFITLASNFGKTGVTYPDGDLNYDGIVSISDFLDLASKFNTSLPPPPPAAAPAADISITRDSMTSAPRQSRRHRLKGHHHPRPKAAEAMIWSRFLRV